MVRGSQVGPRGVWSPEANAKRQSPVGDAAVVKGLACFVPSHVFRKDLLAYCTLRNLIPHPKLLPLHPDEEERQGAASNETSSSGNIYDTSEVEAISVKHWQIDEGNFSGLCFVLPFSKIRSISLLSAGLTTEQVSLFCSTIPKTQVTALQLEWNPITDLQAQENNVMEPIPVSVEPPSATTSRPASAAKTISRPPSAGVSGNVNKQQHSAVQNEQEEESSEDQKHELSMQRELQSGGENDASEVFAQLLGEGSALVSLSLRSDGITSRGAVALADALSSNKTLEVLNLFQNAIGDAGARAFTHALPFNTTLKTLSLANNRISGRGATMLVDGLTKYVAPPELLARLEAAESVIHKEMEQAKKAKKRIDRATVFEHLGLPLLEIVDGVQYAPGNSTLEELTLSGNEQLGRSDIEVLSIALDKFQPKLQTHLRCIKLQRLPKLHSSDVQDPQHHQQPLSEFIKL